MHPAHGRPRFDGYLTWSFFSVLLPYLSSPLGASVFDMGIISGPPHMAMVRISCHLSSHIAFGFAVQELWWCKHWRQLLRGGKTQPPGSRISGGAYSTGGRWSITGAALTTQPASGGA